MPGELPKHQGRLYVLDGTDRNSSGNIGTSGRIEADRSVITAWIDLVHGNSDGLIHICSVGNWEGRTFSEPTDAADYAMRLDAEGAQGIYMRTTTLASVPRSGERGGDEASKTLPGFAADMDIAGPGHKTAKPLPTSPETCFAIISATGLPQPTLWVHSGGGVYPWWMFDQGVDLTEENSLTWAQGLSERLHETIAAWAEDLGWFYGAGVKDMSRVLRIPGTVNRKPGTEPRLAHVIQPAAYEFHHRDALEIAIDQAWRNRPKPKRPETPRSAPAVRPEGSSLRPGDDFNDRAHWADILTPHGWTYMYHRGSTWYWRRPGKDSGEHSATTGRKGVGSEDRLYVFSDATEFTQNEPYNKFAAYALLNHGGDFAAATRDLRSQGFGGELPQLHRATDAVSLVRPAAQVPVAVEPVDEQKPAESALAVQANKALPVLGHDGLPAFTNDVYTSQHWDEMGLVSMYSSTFCRGLRYIGAIDEWRIWDGKRWTRDDRQRHRLASRKLVSGLLDYARTQEAAGNERGSAMVKAAQKLATMNKMAQLPNAAKSDECLTAVPQEFDRHKHLVTVDNGILNLRTGELSDFDPDLMLTKKINAKFDPDAKGEGTLRFLESTQPDAEVRAYMKRLVGYTVL